MSERIKTERRISKYARPEVGHPLVHYRRIASRPLLTERDKEIILLVYYSRCITTRQIAQNLFRFKENGEENKSYLTTCRRRLRVLYLNHIVDRFFTDVGLNNGTSEQHVVLDEVGAYMVAGYLGVPVNEVKWRKEQNEVRLPYLQHTVEINEIGNIIREYARSYGHSVPVWRVEAHNYHQFGDYRFCPDAYFQYRADGAGFHGFLEHHRGTMTPHQFRAEKVPKYREFMKSGEYLKHYKSFPFVFVSCYDWDTCNELKHAVEKEGAGGVVWHFSTVDLIAQGWMQAIWLVNDSERLANIADYLTPGPQK